MTNELYHFNPNHDKLGRFASSPGGIQKMAETSQSTKHYLNALDERRSKIQDKIDSRITSASDKAKYKKHLLENEKYTKLLLKEARKKKYDIKSSPYSRNVRGNKYGWAALLGMVLGMPIGILTYPFLYPLVGISIPLGYAFISKALNGTTGVVKGTYYGSIPKRTINNGYDFTQQIFDQHARMHQQMFDLQVSMQNDMMKTMGLM